MPRFDSIWQKRQSSAATTMSPASIISMPTVNTIPCTAVTIGLRHWRTRPKGSTLPSGIGVRFAPGPKNFGMSSPAVKSFPAAHSTPAHSASSRSSSVSASDSCSIIPGSKAFFFAGLSMTIFRTWSWRSL